MRLIIFLLLFPAIAWSAVDMVKVDKSAHKMYLLENNQVIKTYSISLGAHPKGHKQQEGDKKTPEGQYLLDYIKEDSAYYRSIHISYPNKIDRLSAKKKGVDPGGLIMIHGQRNGLGWLSSISKKWDWTNGCIAISNKEMDEFLALVRVGTPIVIEW